MPSSVQEILSLYNPENPLEKASTIPAPWYFDPRINDLERCSVFAATWQPIGRLDQVKSNVSFFPAEVAAEPLVVVRSEDGELRAFLTCAGITPLPW